MRNLLALVGLVVVGVGGIGWYMGWYTVKVAKNADGTIQVQTNLDTQRVSRDTGDGARHVGELLGRQADQAQAETLAPPPAATPVPAPEIESNRRNGWLFGGSRNSTEATGTGKR